MPDASRNHCLTATTLPCQPTPPPSFESFPTLIGLLSRYFFWTLSVTLGSTNVHAEGRPSYHLYGAHLSFTLRFGYFINAQPRRLRPGHHSLGFLAHLTWTYSFFPICQLFTLL
ncbi:uncharacterized protein BDR25DRAFT_391073 [Lindgomyces ingoldianus]|uniref:Uncharacterized protein n=1 Tax=Lindgomyces ingoldianus TaxID=673940 RepID=A0ACB6RBF0_9PLEO|nr:uncharacterized protein BDR25DRAFT_391073 [Lindgomyces ingoldianus]KAF2476608.1 hypothetical protein BDR25DRAFT_391073 [Lindgomyces ingoldianus]